MLTTWNDTAPKRVIIDFVECISKEGSADFVPPPERIAVFNNGQLLWTENPSFIETCFA